MKHMKTIYTYLFLIFMGCASALAQDQPTGEVEDVQVIIEKDKPLVLPIANRLYQRTEIRKIQEDSVSLSYNEITQPLYNFDNYQPSFMPKSFSAPNTYKGFTNHVKAGFGNYQSPLLEAYVALEERLNYVGLFLQHESFGKGPVRGSESAFSNNQFVLDGRYVARYFEFRPILNYKREGFYYYGYDAQEYQLASPISDIYAQDRAIYNSWNAGGTFKTISKSDWSMSFTPSYQGVSMRIGSGDQFNTDNILNLQGAVKYDLSKSSVVNLNLGYLWAQYNGGASIFDRSKAIINPTYQYQNDQLQVAAGINMVAGSDSSTHFYFYPDIQAKYYLNEKFSITARIDGDLDFNTLQTLYDQNKYLDDSLTLVNTNRPISFQGIFGAKLSERLLIEGSLGYDVIKNQPLFVYSTYDSSRFSTRYDENFGRFQFGVKASYFIENQTFITANFHYYAYKEGSEAEAWFLPLRELELAAQHTIIKGLTAKTMLTIIGGIKAPYVNVNMDQALVSAYNTLDPIFNLGIDVNYELKENIVLFLSADNIFNQHYERYLNYPSRGIAAKFGFIFHF
ncbi:MAG: hypothetical protein ACJA08_002229 [Cyclobacteriaceae bacterium]|jgi:hypothetical protein